jgi:hypothetical protein
VLVERDPGRLAGQQHRQLRLALADRQWLQVRAVKLQQVEAFASLALAGGGASLNMATPTA